MQYSGSTGDTFDVAPIVPRTTARITVAPQQYSDAIELVFHAHYPTGIFPDANIIAGVTLYNPTVPSYIPMATRKNGNWLNLSDNSGHILIRQNGWQDRSLELYASAKQPNQGHNRIRRNNQWLQLPKMWHIFTRLTNRHPPVGIRTSETNVSRSGCLTLRIIDDW